VTAMPQEQQRGRRQRLDITAVQRPPTTPEQWRDPGRAVGQLRSWAEGRTIELITWYLLDKRAKRRASRWLRAAAVVIAVAGGVAPLVSAGVSGINPNLGYVLLGVAAGCVAFDRFFGISAAWMRDIATVHALQGRLTRFHLDWAAWEAAEAGAVSTPDGAAGTQAAIALIDSFVTDVVSLTQAETAQWIAEFSSSVAALHQQATPGVATPQDLIAWNRGSDLAST
jgi:SMODS and SLOG-associating 2TM effector domain 2